MMVTFDYDSLITFMRCPLRFKFEYLEGIETGQESIKIFFKQTLHQTMKHFFKKLDEDEVILTQKQIHDYWGDLWLADVDSEKIIYGNASEKANLTKKGYSYLNKFHRYQSDKPGVPIKVDLDYSIDFMDEYKFSGNIELIREKDNNIQIVNFSTSRYVPDNFRKQNDIRFTANSYAFQKIFEQKEDEIIYYHIRKNKSVNLHRDEDDYKKLLTIMDNVYKSIEDELFYPRISYKCKQCPYHKHCTAWKGE